MNGGDVSADLAGYDYYADGTTTIELYKDGSNKIKVRVDGNAVIDGNWVKFDSVTKLSGSGAFDGLENIEPIKNAYLK